MLQLVDMLLLVDMMLLLLTGCCAYDSTRWSCVAAVLHPSRLLDAPLPMLWATFYGTFAASGAASDSVADLQQHSPASPSSNRRTLLRAAGVAGALLLAAAGFATSGSLSPLALLRANDAIATVDDDVIIARSGVSLAGVLSDVER
ncbi:hypothetical protein PybrP1_010689, partial [[Pythium] brassicae (nom. inval.)]